MSMYNMMMGMNKELVAITSVALGMNITEKIPRFRDVFTHDDDCPVKSEGYDVLIYTRMGGGNYECWQYTYDDCGEEGAELCPYHELLELEKEPWYVGGYDDSFDCTYRTLIVKFTDEQNEALEKAIKEAKDDSISTMGEEKG